MEDKLKKVIDVYEDFKSSVEDANHKLGGNTRIEKAFIELEDELDRLGWGEQ